MVIGIDPGKLGGITKVNQDGSVEWSIPMPTIDKELDLHAITEILANEQRIATMENERMIVVLEHVRAIFGASAAATFSFGRGVGQIEGVVSALALPLYTVPPKTWQKVIFEGKKEKDTKQASAAFCKRTWPKHRWTPTERATKPHDGMTDAACIAEYGRRTFL